MRITVTGKIEVRDFGGRTWALVTDRGETYELLDPPLALQDSQGRVKITGQVREDVMTLAMIGPVLEITSFEAIA
jgi:hypothetical protein